MATVIFKSKMAADQVMGKQVVLGAVDSYVGLDKSPLRRLGDEMEECW